MKQTIFIKRFGARLKPQIGLSILEVLVAMVILAVGILGLAPMLVTSMQGNQFSRETTDVAYIAQDRIEQFKNLATITPIPFNETTTGINGKYTRTANVADNGVDASVPVGVYRINVTVSWNDDRGSAHSSTYSTFKAK